MSSTNYDVELNIAYDYNYRHYIPNYTVEVPHYHIHHFGWDTKDYWDYHCYVSFDDGAETNLGYIYNTNTQPVPAWAINAPRTGYNDPYASYSYKQDGDKIIPDSGVFNKIFIRNPYRELVTFTQSNCRVLPLYSIKAAFEVQWNATGFVANQNAQFKCSTIQKNTYQQYQWVYATVYIKKTTDANYTSVGGAISGTWSDYTISTSLTLQDGYTYDAYIVATADDGSTAQTPVAQFVTTDATAVAKCISPSGAFTSGNVTFAWTHTTDYGTPQYAYDLQYSYNNGSTWTTVGSHVVTRNTSATATLTNAGVVLWRVRTYNSNNVAGAWAEATFVNQVPASPPTNLQVTTKGRPTVTWASASQSAYQVQLLLGDSIAYDSGAIYTSEKSHFVNQYMYDTRAYTVRVRVYNALGEVSAWTEMGYQQPSINDVTFIVETAEEGGANIVIVPDGVFTKYFILRDNKPIAKVDYQAVDTLTYYDKYANGLTNYGVVGVTSEDQSDIQTKGTRTSYPRATIVAPNGQQFAINKRVDEAYQIQTNNSADVNKASYIGDSLPTHYPSKMKLKSFSITCFDDQNIMDDLLGTVVFYADNFGNGGWCMVTAYDKTDNFVKNGQGAYGNEVALTLEVTNYDDSIEYPL